MEDSTSNLSSLPEEQPENGGTAALSGSKSPSAFSSKPDRPPIQYVHVPFSRFSYYFLLLMSKFKPFMIQSFLFCV